MHYVVEILSAFMMWYIGVTNIMATHIENLFLSEVEVEETIENKAPDEPIARTNSGFFAIPNVLRNSLEYQQAGLQSALNPSTVTNNPINALVNIFCTSTTKSHVRTTTGTGFFIHSDGVILTNAHVAQYLLLTRSDALGKTECIVRTGNPASPQYEADILYISPSWVASNAGSINSTNPTGTGERDFALLYVTKSVDNSPLPTSFPALATDTNLIPKSITGSTVYATGYPAESLIRNGIDTNLIPKQATTTITDLFTLGTNYADVMSLSGSSLGEHGSSGGPVTTSENQAIGMITTKGDDLADGMGSLRAITLSYIDRAIKDETGFPLENIMSGDLPFRAKVFSDTMVPFLAEVLTNNN